MWKILPRSFNGLVSTRSKFSLAKLHIAHRVDGIIGKSDFIKDTVSKFGPFLYENSIWNNKRKTFKTYPSILLLLLLYVFISFITTTMTEAMNVNVNLLYFSIQPCSPFFWLNGRPNPDYGQSIGNTFFWIYT